MKRKPKPTDENELPPECPVALTYVNWTRASLDAFDTHGGYLADDVVGCLIASFVVFRADYLPRGRVPTENEHLRAACAVFRDFLSYGRDVLDRAGWWPTVWVDDAGGVAFSRFLTWRNGVFERVMTPGSPERTSDRGRRIRSIWEKYCIPNATRGGRVSLRALQSDVGKCATEAGLRGADGRDKLTLKELRSEAALIELAAEKKGELLIYYDAKGRGRISWRAAKDLHPNRGQRMPLNKNRRSIGRLVHRRGSPSTTAEPHQEELNEALRADALRRTARSAESARRESLDRGIDRVALIDALRELVRERGPAAAAALAYLLPIMLGHGEKLSRREACSVVAPPVTADAMRHQEAWLRPHIEKVAKALDPI